MSGKTIFIIIWAGLCFGLIGCLCIAVYLDHINRKRIGDGEEILIKLVKKGVVKLHYPSNNEE